MSTAEKKDWLPWAAMVKPVLSIARPKTRSAAWFVRSNCVMSGEKNGGRPLFGVYCTIIMKPGFALPWPNAIQFLSELSATNVVSVMPVGSTFVRPGRVRVAFGAPLHLRGDDYAALAREVEERVRAL